MARPNILSLSPSSGLTGGGVLVEILGSNFQLPPDPPATGIAPAPSPTVEVLFDDEPGTGALVISDGRLFVRAPRTPRSAEDAAGTVDVTVRNIDQSGAVITGETTTASAAFTYELPDLTVEHDLTRLVRALMQELKRQVHGNVSLHVHTDYRDDPSQLNLEHIGSLPAIVLTGPELPENRFYSVNELREVELPSDEYNQLRPPYTVDLEFDILGVTDSTITTINLMATVQSFFQRNKWLSMPADGAAPDGETVRYEMDMLPDGRLRRVNTSNDSNIRAFSGSFTVRGFHLDDPTMAVNATKELTEGALIGEDGGVGGVVQFFWE